MASFLPISRPFLPEGKTEKTGLDRAPNPVSDLRENGHPSARAASTWFPAAPAYSADLDVDDDDDADSWCCCEPLNSTERFLGWLTCFLGGLILSAISLVYGTLGVPVPWLWLEDDNRCSFNDMLLGKNSKFAVTYTIGNIIGLAGTSFLVGPLQQLRNMTDKSRLVTSCIFIGSLIATLLSSIYIKIGIIIVFFVCVQWLAYMWYSLSYIPYGQRTAMWILRRFVPD